MLGLRRMLHFAVIVLTLLFLTNLSYSNPVSVSSSKEISPVHRRRDLQSHRSDEAFSVGIHNNSYHDNPKPATTAFSSTTIQGHAEVYAVSEYMPSSLSLSARGNPVNNIAGHAITWLYTSFIYPVSDAAAELTRIYTGFRIKIEYLAARTPPLAEFSLRLGSGVLTMSCPNPIAWDTVLSIVASMQLLGEVGLTILWRAFFPALKVWAALEFMQVPRPGDTVD